MRTGVIDPLDDHRTMCIADPTTLHCWPQVTASKLIRKIVHAIDHTLVKLKQNE